MRDSNIRLKLIYAIQKITKLRLIGYLGTQVYRIMISVENHNLKETLVIRDVVAWMIITIRPSLSLAKKF